MTVKDLCTTFNGDDIHVFIFDMPIKGFEDTVYDNSITDVILLTMTIAHLMMKNIMSAKLFCGI